MTKDGEGYFKVINNHHMWSDLVKDNMTTACRIVGLLKGAQKSAQIDKGTQLSHMVTTQPKRIF